MLGTAYAITAIAFENKTDKGGNPYMDHCIYVMNKMPHHDTELRCIALMHDLIEDTKWTADMLYDEGFSQRVVQGVVDLTHDYDLQPSYLDDYIPRIATNPDAVKVKMADLEHNSKIFRMKGLASKDFKRLKKYFLAYEYLRKV